MKAIKDDLNLEKVTFDMNKVRCPICNRHINKLWLDSSYSTKGLICFVVECWSGEIDIDSARHIFRLKIFNAPELEVNYENNKSL